MLLGGGGRGIGAAAARQLAEQGTRVVVLDAFDGSDDFYPLADERDRAALRVDRRITTLSVDLRDPAATAAAVDEADERVGAIDAAVALAGAVAGGSPLWETSSDTLARSLESNVITTWNLAYAVLPRLLTRPAEARPTFVAVTSTAGEHGLFGLSPYVVAKHATVGVVRALAADLAGTSVTACGVAPGATDTTMLRRTAELYGIEDVDELAQHQQGRTPLAPEETAAVVVHAATAGRVHHGAILAADGGFGRV